MSGLFCVLEGIDGSGKTTLLRSLAEALKATGPVAGLEVLREPTTLPTGRRIRELLGAGGEGPERREWLDLFLADRAANVAENIRPALDRGDVILQDRYFYSTAAYQGDPEQPPTPADILRENLAAGFPEPHIVLYLDLDPEAALARARARGEQIETFENLAELRRIYANYESVLPETAVRLDAGLPAAEVQAVALKAILNRGKELGTL